MLTISAVPKNVRPSEGSSSMMMEKVNQMLARANHEKIKLKTLYYTRHQRMNSRNRESTYNSLDVEEEHANDAMAGPVELEEVDERILSETKSVRVRNLSYTYQPTTEAAKEPFNQRRR